MLRTSEEEADGGVRVQPPADVGMIRQREQIKSVTVGLLNGAKQLVYIADAGMRTEPERDFLCRQCATPL